MELEYVRDVFWPSAHCSVIVCVDCFTVIRQAAPTLHNRTSDDKSPSAHPTKAIFELVFHFDHKMMPWKFRDDISKGSGVIVLTTNSRTNRRCWKQYNPRYATLRCAGGNERYWRQSLGLMAACNAEMIGRHHYPVLAGSVTAGPLPQCHWAMYSMHEACATLLLNGVPNAKRRRSVENVSGTYYTLDYVLIWNQCATRTFCDTLSDNNNNNLTIIDQSFVCLSSPLAPSLLYGRGPWPGDPMLASTGPNGLTPIPSPTNLTPLISYQRKLDFCLGGDTWPIEIWNTLGYGIAALRSSSQNK